MAALLLHLGCGSDGGGKADSGAADDASVQHDGRVGNTTDDDADVTDEDAGPCVPLGCEEQNFECGTATDGCGAELDCSGIKVCQLPQICGADNRCDCTPKTCDELSAAAGSHACGSADDGCGNQIECGGCDTLGGDRWLCNDGADICECTARGQAEACEGRACGSVADGCGGTGISCGTCSASRDCSDAGACACKPHDSAYAATVCGGKTCGSVVLDGCEFTCGAPCGAPCTSATGPCAACDCASGSQCDGARKNCCTPGDQASLCTDKACGTTVTDDCTGATYVCGCGNSSTCVDKSLVVGASANVCVSNERAALLGGYVVRTHVFSKFLTGVQRAETVSLIRIMQTSGGGLQMEDTGCVAATLSDNGSVHTMSPAYFQIPTQVASASQPTAGHFQRDGAAHREGVGFNPQMPAFCTAGAAPTPQADFDAYPNDPDNSPTPGSGSQKPWLGASGAACTCPAQASVCDPSAITQSCMPPTNTGSQSSSTDCRLNDPDEDGRPGFSVVTSLGQLVSAITASRTIWVDGEVRADGFHTAHTADTNDGVPANAQPTLRAFTGCGPESSGCGALGGPDGPCGDVYNRVQFRKVSPAAFAQLDCSVFYNAPLATVAKGDCWKTSSSGSCTPVNTAIKQTAIEAYFDGTNAPLPACGAGGACPTGTLCKNNVCYPMTSQGACTDSTDCGAGWVCDKAANVGGSCWPVASMCQYVVAK